MIDRFVVREVTGYRTFTASASAPPISMVVLDRLANYRIVRQWQSEDPRGIGASLAAARCRREAEALADRLNGEHRAWLASLEVAA